MSVLADPATLIAPASAAAAVLLTLASSGPVQRPSLRVGLPVLVVGVGALAAVLAASVDLRVVALAAIAAAVTLGIAALVRRRRAQAAAERTRDQVAGFCDALAAELGAGLPVTTALRRAVADHPGLTGVAAAADLDADVPATLRTLTHVRGQEDLRHVAATWQVAQRSGAALGPALHTLAATVRAERAVARTAAAELAGAHATARLMAGLPLLMLLLGSSLGGDPLHFLARTWPGLLCLAAGVGLMAAGQAWLLRIERAVTEA